MLVDQAPLKDVPLSNQIACNPMTMLKLGTDFRKKEEGARAPATGRWPGLAGAGRDCQNKWKSSDGWGPIVDGRGWPGLAK